MNEVEQEILRSWKCGDVDDAWSLVLQRFRQNPGGHAWELLGLVQFSRGRFQKSVSALECAMSQVPLSPEGRVHLGRGYALIGRMSLARDYLASLIDDRGLGVSLLLQVATGLEWLGESGLATAACLQATRLAPHSAEAWYALANYVGRCPEGTEEAERYARRAITLAPECSNYRIGLAVWLGRLGREEEAFEILRVLTPGQLRTVDCGNCLSRVADIFESFNDHRRAVICRERVLQLDAFRQSSANIEDQP